MNNLKHPFIELLAPAKNLECGITAVNSGADALYIGGPEFGARAKSGNSLEDIEKLIAYAHPYWVKVYLTLNTLLKDEEFESALKIIQKCYEMGIDGIIIQDFGLLAHGLPPIPIHASTQMHNVSVERIVFLEKCGFSRVILGRELNIQEIQNIRKNTSIELEYFIHGALCTGYSGQCYFSETIGNRSGNRGECGQPCRKIYSLKDCESKKIVSKGHLLSLKDQKLDPVLSQLLQAGVSSLKIEGRMKDNLYVSNTVSYYRKKLDTLLNSLSLKKSSSGEIFEGFPSDLSKTFNRGFSLGFFGNQKGEMAEFRTPKNIGEEIGKIIHVEKDFFTLEKDSLLSPNDGISFFNDQILSGTKIKSVQGKKVFPLSMKGITENLTIFLNYHSQFVKYAETHPFKRKINLSLEISSHNNTYFFTFMDDNEITTTIELKEGYSVADNPEKIKLIWENQLKKTGNTPFSLESIHWKISEVPFLPVKEINLLRRNALEKHLEKRTENIPKDITLIEENDFPYPENKIFYQGNVLNSFSKKFFEKHHAEVLEFAPEFKLPENFVVLKSRFCILGEMGLCLKILKKNCQYGLVDDHGRQWKLEFDCKNCEMSILI